MKKNKMTTESYINPMDIPGEFLEKYQRSGPRYTSYPTAPQFKADFDKEIIIRRWKETNMTGNGLSIYTHFPFCKTRCLYCGCYTNTDQPEDTKEKYLGALKRELDSLFTFIDPSRQVHQLMFGGGTPTHLSPRQLTAYMEYLSGILTLNPDGERSIEIDPRGVDVDYLDKLIRLGFNRVSFGVQDLDPVVQKNINRILEEDKLNLLITFLRKQGLEAINFDLIYGLPGQTAETFSTTINKVIAFHPSRIALFGYAHVPWVSPHQEAMDKLPMPTPAQRMELFGIAFDLLLKAGYRHIGMDHFAHPLDELVAALESHTLTRNFMGYTTRRGLDLVGIGASSISSVGITYVQNDKNLPTYLDNRDGVHWKKALVLDPEDCLRREIIIDLFCNFYLDTAAVEKKFALDFHRHFAAELEALKPMEQDGLLQIEDGALRVTEMGRFFIRGICMHFDQYLPGENPENRYSKAI